MHTWRGDNRQTGSNPPQRASTPSDRWDVTGCNWSPDGDDGNNYATGGNSMSQSTQSTYDSSDIFEWDQYDKFVSDRPYLQEDEIDAPPSPDGLCETVYTITYDRKGRARLVVIG